MGIILTRTPYFIENQGFDDGASLSVDIGDIVYDTSANFTPLYSYTLNFRGQKRIDISPLVNDYIGTYDFSYDSTSTKEFKYARGVRVTILGEINEVEQPAITNFFVATNGYLEYEDGYNKDFKQDLYAKALYGGSNDIIYRFDDQNTSIPLVCPVNSDSTTTQVDFKYEGEIVFSTLVDYGTQGGEVWDFNRNVTRVSSSPYLNFFDRLPSTAIQEPSKCQDDFFKQYDWNIVDEVDIVTTDGVETYSNTLNIITISECKYQPYKVSFLNRFGAEEDLWFFKRSDKTINVNRESFMRNTIEQYSQGINTYHSYKDFNVNGRESIKLNSGWVDESFYECFKQLYLSEYVWIWMDNKKLPVNVKNTELLEKLHINEKLINYEINLEFSYDKLSNIV